MFGAQAVIAYGVPRLSADVDVTVKLEPDDPQRFASAMQAAGFADSGDSCWQGRGWKTSSSSVPEW